MAREVPDSSKELVILIEHLRVGHAARLLRCSDPVLVCSGGFQSRWLKAGWLTFDIKGVKLFRRRRSDGHVGLETRSPELGIKHKDLLVLKQLIDHGADLTQPRHVLHYLYFDQEESARQAAGGVTAPFSAEVRSPEADDKWLLLCEAHEYTLSPEIVRGDTDFFESLAAAHGGHHDGWEASV